MSTDEILDKRLNTLSNVKDGWKVKDIYPLLFRDAIWYQAYQNIYPNKGAFTKGINEDTLDNFDKERISKIITSLKDKSYTPTPVRRVLMSKSNGKTRPLGIPTGTDKLVQEACRIILEAIYEPKFSNLSHGFRPNRSCHTALKNISTWMGTKWFIEFDIKGCFDNIDHEILINILNKRIDDKRFISLITKLIKAGYLENWKYGNTFSGTPQGGIISPILANIYLDQLDKFIENKCNIINSTPNERKKTPEYNRLQSSLIYYKKICLELENKLTNIINYNNNELAECANNDHKVYEILSWCIEQRIINSDTNLSRVIKSKLDYIYVTYDKSMSELVEATKYKLYLNKYNDYSTRIKEITIKLRTLKSTNMSVGLNRLHYIRYADDFVCGYIGTKSEAETIFNEISEFLLKNLKLDISKEKSRIQDKEGIIFLGYKISITPYSEERITTVDGVNKRRPIQKPVFKVPTQHMIKLVSRNGYGSYIENKSNHRSYLINFDDIEIIKQYNAELRGLINYYKYALNCKKLIGKVQWLSHYSLLKTLASKHKCSVAQLFKNKIIKIRKHSRIGKVWYYTIGNTGKEIEVFNIKDVEYKNIFELDTTSCNDNCNVKTINIRSSALKKLIAENCEICGKSSDDVSIVLHHWNPIRNIPETDTFWNKVKKMRQRKTIAVCHECHMRIHHG